MADVQIAVAVAGERTVIANLMQLYAHDFSEILAGTIGADRAALGPDGRFPDYPLDGWWRDAGHVPLLIRANERLAGFALLNVHGHSGLPMDHNMAEFFVVRAFRRGGIGMAAAHAIFSGWPGQWEVSVMRANRNALAFWRRAVGSARGVSAASEAELCDPAWDGNLLRFRIGPPERDETGPDAR